MKRSTSPITWQVFVSIVVVAAANLADAVPLIPFSFWNAPAIRISFTQSGTHYPNLCYQVLLVRALGNVARQVSVDTTVTLSSTGPLTFYSDGACNNSIASTSIYANTTSQYIYGMASGSGAVTATATATGYQNGNLSDTISAAAYPYTWVGTTSNNWGTGSNWSGGVVPVNQIAVFDSGCINCNPITAGTGVGYSLLGMVIRSGFTGSVTKQGTDTMTISASGFKQLAGTFNGGSGNMTVNGGFSIEGGTFNSTSGTLTTTSALTNFGAAATFNHSSGTIAVAPSSQRAGEFYPNSNNFHKLTIAGSSSNLTMTGTANVASDLSLASTPFQTALQGGDINASGDVLMSGYGARGTTNINFVSSTAQQITASGATAEIPQIVVNKGVASTLTLSGTITVSGSYTLNTGNIDPSTSTLIFYGRSIVTIFTLKPGTETYNHLTFSNVNLAQYDLQANFNVAGTLTFNGTNSALSGPSISTSNSSYFSCTGDLAVSNWGAGGTAKVKMVGSTNQNIVGSTNPGPVAGNLANMLDLEIASTGGTVSFSNYLWIARNFKVTSGTLSTAGSNVNLVPYSNSGNSYDAGGKTMGNVSIYSAGVSTTSIVGGLTASGSVTIGKTGVTHTFNMTPASSALNVTGTLTISSGTTLNLNSGSHTEGTLSNSGTINP